MNGLDNAVKGVGVMQAYCQTITISNPSRATVEASLRAGSSDRWTVSPTKLVLKPQQSVDVDVRLRILRFAQKQKAIQQGQRDIFHIKVTDSKPVCTIRQHVFAVLSAPLVSPPRDTAFLGALVQLQSTVSLSCRKVLPYVCLVNCCSLKYMI